LACDDFCHRLTAGVVSRLNGVKWFSANRITLGGTVFLLTVLSFPGVRREVCPARFCRLLEYYQTAKNTNAPLTFGERVMYSLSQANAADVPRVKTTTLRRDAF
jgi:hypothetical protein